MTYKILFTTFILICIHFNGNAQNIPLDTLTSHCSVCSIGNNAWGHHDKYYKPENCPISKRDAYYN